MINDHDQIDEKQASALIQFLKRASKLGGNALYYGSALGMIALTGGVGLPSELADIAKTLGVNAVSDMLGRIARDMFFFTWWLNETDMLDLNRIRLCRGLNGFCHLNHLPSILYTLIPIVG